MFVFLEPDIGLCCKNYKELSAVGRLVYNSLFLLSIKVSLNFLSLNVKLGSLSAPSYMIVPSSFILLGTFLSALFSFLLAF